MERKTVDTWEHAGFTVYEGHFFGIKEYPFFFHIQRIYENGELVMNVYQHTKPEAKGIIEGQRGVYLKDFAYRIKQGTMWYSEHPPIVLGELPKPEKKPEPVRSEPAKAWATKGPSIDEPLQVRKSEYARKGKNNSPDNQISMF